MWPTGRQGVAARAPCGANLTPFRHALAISPSLSGCISPEMAVLYNFNITPATLLSMRNAGNVKPSHEKLIAKSIEMRYANRGNCVSRWDQSTVKAYWV